METRKRRVDIDYFEPLNGNVKKPKVSIGTLSKSKADKCSTCRQLLAEVVYYNGHANNSNEEFISLTNEKLSLFTGDEESIHESDELPTHKITNFSVYDKNGHLCPFDTGLIEKNVILYMSGYLKPIYDDNPLLDGGVPTHDIGPINEWYISGFDGGEKAVVGVLTPYATYVLMEASEEYSPFVKMLRKKAMLVKTVTEYLLDHVLDDPTYEDLLFHIQSQGNEDLSEDFLLQHAQFICDQIYILDQAVEDEVDDEKQMITTPCMRTLVQMSGVTFRRRKQLLRDQNMQEKKLNFTKATTTEMVRSIFENFFPDQIDGKETKGPKKKRCGVCDACQSPDCGKCPNCKDMPKFGGGGKGKQACKNRKCPNMAIQDAEESENENETDEDVDDDKAITLKKCAVQIVNPVKWPKEPICEQKGKKYYYSTIVGDMLIKLGEFVMLAPNTPEEPCYVAKVINMYSTITVKGTTNMLHYQLFCRGIDTILGATSDPQELFVTDECDGCDLGCVVRKAQVTHKKVPENWSELGGTETLPAQLDDDGQTFFFNKKYTPQTGTFSDYVPEEITEDFIHSCFCCRKKIDEKQLSKPTLHDGGVQYHGEVYRVGSAVFLDPTVYDFSPHQSDSTSEPGKPTVDTQIFTEYYRKTDDTKGSNLDTPEPFCIALIEEIRESKNGDIGIRVRLFYRPENTRNSVFLAFQNDLNQVYWSDLTISTPFTKVRGKCYLMYFGEDNLDRQWCDEGPYRFYFTQAYDPRTYEYTEVPAAGRKIGCKGKGKGVGKGKSAKSAHYDLEAQDWEKIGRPLKCMDVFAGCGGLSLGLHQTGICETKWAIEKDVAAAQAFKLNNRDCKVFTDDCNDILQQVIAGKGEVKGLPSKGDVEMLIGGPPCQGFSGMNRFNAGQYSLFKNSLVVTYLSFCEYYRPKYFVLENVRNFVSFKRSMVLKLALRCLTAIGYQVRFGVLQAGHYGVPQTRRRLILIAAAPGCVLPKLPEPQHVFNRRGCHLSFALDGNRYSNGNFWTESAPYRTICVRDAISDLPEIPNGWSKAEMECEEDATSHFQRRLHKVDNSMLYDHICKEMAPLVVARISYIPINPGSDWRDLPNSIVTLSDGKLTQKLIYNYRSIKQKQNNKENRAVCRCATGEHCDPSDRQVNTLIPWCLPHTGDRHNHWAGLYGRLEWDGFFGTTITNPEPMGKQGRVLHPEQNRVVSVRECARSQGFPDHFKFHGSIMDKHRQVGNAVPPPLGEAIGIEIRKALVQCKFD